jgi:hypothetical protein
MGMIITRCCWENCKGEVERLLPIDIHVVSMQILRCFLIWSLKTLAAKGSNNREIDCQLNKAATLNFNLELKKNNILYKNLY